MGRAVEFGSAKHFPVEDSSLGARLVGPVVVCFGWKGGGGSIPFTVLGMCFGFLVFWFRSFLLGVCKKQSVFSYHTKSRDAFVPWEMGCSQLIVVLPGAWDVRNFQP